MFIIAIFVGVFWLIISIHMLIKSIKLFLLEKKIQAARASKNIRIKTEECKQPLHHSDHESYESFSKNQNRETNSINNQENLDNPTLK